MICPFCQADLDPKTLSCPRCGAAHPAGGGGAMRFGLGLRTGLVSFFLLVVATLMLVTCVLGRVPPSGQSPDMKSAQAQRALLMMMQHRQETQNEAMRPPMR